MYHKSLMFTNLFIFELFKKEVSLSKTDASSRRLNCFFLLPALAQINLQINFKQALKFSILFSLTNRQERQNNKPSAPR